MAAETALILAMIAIPFIFIMIGKNMEFLVFNDIPISQYVFYMIALGLCLPIANAALKLNETNALGLDNTLNGFYAAVMYITVIILSLSTIGVLFFGFKKIYEAGKQ